jgi:hypothetical protein
MTVCEALEQQIREQGQEFQRTMAQKVLEVTQFAATMQPEDFLKRSDDIERVERMGRRVYGLDKTEVSGDKLVINLSVLQDGMKPAEGRVVDV